MRLLLKPSKIKKMQSKYVLGQRVKETAMLEHCRRYRSLPEIIQYQFYDTFAEKIEKDTDLILMKKDLHSKTFYDQGVSMVM